jgi:hypothetical protein
LKLPSPDSLRCGSRQAATPASRRLARSWLVVLDGTDGKTALRAASSPAWSSDVINRTPRSPRETRLDRNERQCTSASDRFTEGLKHYFWKK